jgi:HJR/Mrr/RecB family endonuclease
MSPEEFAKKINYPLRQVMLDLKKLNIKCFNSDDLDQKIIEKLEIIYDKRDKKREEMNSVWKKKLEKAQLTKEKNEKYYIKVNEYDLNNIYVIGNKQEKDENGEQGFNLTCNVENNGDSYISIWDNEKDVSEYCNERKMEYDLLNFGTFFELLKSNELKYILLNTKLAKDKDGKIEENKIKIPLNTARESWDFLKKVYRKWGLEENIIEIIKLIIDEKEKITIKILSDNLAGLINEKINYVLYSNTSEEQFKKDYKLEHLKIDNITFYDEGNKLFENEDKFHKSKIDFFGHSFKLTIAGKNKKIILNGQYKHTEYLTFQDEKADWKNEIIVILGKPVRLSIIDGDIEYEANPIEISSSFMMTKENFNYIKKYFYEKNLILPLAINKFCEEVNTKVKDLIINDYFYNIGVNYINQKELEFFTTENNIILIEILILYNFSNLGKNILLSNGLQRSKIINEKKNSVSKNDEIITKYINENLNALSTIVSEIIKIDDENQLIFVTYRSIYEILKKYLSEKWEVEFGKYYEDIVTLNLENAIERFIEIEDIENLNEKLQKYFIFYLMKHEKLEKENYLISLERFNEVFSNLLKINKKKNLITRIKNVEPCVNEKITLDDVDLMTGTEFEHFIALLFSKMGYETEVTKATGDQGIDVIASKNGKKIGIQAKCYSSSVGNSAIQEVVAGKNHYRLDKAIVITNNIFTDSAQQLAISNDIVLWDRNILKEKIIEIFI